MNATNPDNASFKQNSSAPSADVSAGDKEKECLSVIERKARFAHLLRNKFGIAPLVSEHIAMDFHAVLLDVLSRKKEPATDDVEVEGQNALLPCPFCGSNAAREVDLGWDDPWFAIQCWKGDRIGCGATAGSALSFADARKRWNQRADSGSNASSLPETKKL